MVTWTLGRTAPRPHGRAQRATCSRVLNLEAANLGAHDLVTWTLGRTAPCTCGRAQRATCSRVLNLEASSLGARGLGDLDFGAHGSASPTVESSGQPPWRASAAESNQSREQPWWRAVESSHSRVKSNHGQPQSRSAVVEVESQPWCSSHSREQPQPGAAWRTAAPAWGRAAMVESSSQEQPWRRTAATVESSSSHSRDQPWWRAAATVESQPWCSSRSRDQPQPRAVWRTAALAGWRAAVVESSSQEQPWWIAAATVESSSSHGEHQPW